MIAKTDTLSIRISEEGKRILGLLQEHYGLSQSSVIEMLVREHARQQGLLPQTPTRKSAEG